MSLFAEGIRSSVLACSYSVLLVGLALVVLRRKDRMGALGMFAGFTILSAWIRAAGISNLLAGRGGDCPAGHRRTGACADGEPQVRRPRRVRLFWGHSRAPRGFPCVGEELGSGTDPGAG